jgi:hypothetical protein
MEHDDLLRRISELESLNDQFSTELRYLDELLKKVGFSEGIKSLKSALEELVKE